MGSVRSNSLTSPLSKNKYTKSFKKKKKGLETSWDLALTPRPSLGCVGHGGHSACVVSGAGCAVGVGQALSTVLGSSIHILAGEGEPELCLKLVVCSSSLPTSFFSGSAKPHGRGPSASLELGRQAAAPPHPPRTHVMVRGKHCGLHGPGCRAQRRRVNQEPAGTEHTVVSDPKSS